MKAMAATTSTTLTVAPRRWALPIAFALASIGCASVGAAKDEPTGIDAAPIAAAVVLCKTTLADLERQLGQPNRRGRLHDQRIVSWITAWDPLVRYLAVLVDEHQVVVDLYWDVPSEIAWVPTSQCPG